MTFSPQLEETIREDAARSYPEGRKRSAVVPMLIYAQDEVGAITPELIEEVARRCGVAPLQVDEVVGYYSMLHRKPLGKFHVQVCTNISCLLVGGEELYEHAKKKLGIGHKEVTADGQFSLEEVECMGACSWAPAVEINYDFHHFVTPEKLDQLIDALKKAQLDADASFITNRARSRPESLSKRFGLENSASLDTYLANDGFKAFLQGARDDAGADHRRSESVGAARPRRRGIPHRPEVELRSAHFAQAEIHRHQRG